MNLAYFALNIIVKSTFILICAVLAGVLLRRASASTRHAVWMIAVLSILLLPAAAMMVPRLELPVLPQTAVSVRFLQSPAIDTEHGPGIVTPHPAINAAAGFIPAFVWSAGAALFLGRLMLGLLYIHRLAKSASAVQDAPWRALLAELAQTFGVDRPVRLLFSDAQVSPMTWGLFRHTILLPSSSAEWSEERRRLVLAHELAHVRRNDGLSQILLQAVCGLYWFNPLVWYASRRMRIERERACDDHVLSLGAAAENYAGHLLQIVRGLRSGSAVAFAAVSMAQPSQLETRLVSILDSKASRRRLSRFAASMLSTSAVLLTVSIAMVGMTAAVPLPPVLAAVTSKAAMPPAIAAEPATSQRVRIGDKNTTPSPTVIPPRLLESFPVKYPETGLTIRVEGTVTLEGKVDVLGRISNLRVIKGLGFGLDEQALAAVAAWKFLPALRNGVPIEAITQVDVDFKLPLQLAAPADGTAITFRIGNGVLPPTIISRVDPEYTDEAKALRYMGTVVIEVTVHKDGTLKVDKVIRELEHGLTEKAIEALEQWKFKPGTRNGEAVDVSLNVEVNFNLK